MVRTLTFHGRGHGLDSWLGNQDPTSHMEQQKKKVYSEVVLHLEVGLERIVIFQCGILLAKHKEGLLLFFFSIYSNFPFCISVKLQFSSNKNLRLLHLFLNIL